MPPIEPSHRPLTYRRWLRRPLTVQQWLFNILTIACICAAFKYWRIISIGPAGGPYQTMTFVEFLSDSIRLSGPVRIVFTNNSPRMVRLLTFGAKGEHGRFGPLAPGQSCECRMPNPPAGTTVPMTYIEVTTAGDSTSTWPIPSFGWEATRAYGLNADRSMSINFGPFPPSR